MAHDWGAARPVPQLKQHLTQDMNTYLGLNVSYQGGPEAYFASRVSVDPRFAACDVSVYPFPVSDLTVPPGANYFCIPKNIAETRDVKGDTVLTPEYLTFLNGFFGEYRGRNIHTVDLSGTRGITFVEDAQSFADWAFDVPPSGDKPPRGIAGPAQLLDSATDASSWFKNVPSEGNETEGIGNWKVEVIDGGDPTKYVWDGDFAFRSTKQVRLTASGTVIDFPVGMKTGPSIRTLSALMCAYLKKMKTQGTNIRNYMVQLLQYVPPDKREPGGAVTQRKLRVQEMRHIEFLAHLFEQLFLQPRNHDFNLKLIAFLKYVGDKGQNIYARKIEATAGTTGDRLSALSFVLFGDTPAIYRDGKGNHVFICPPGLRTSPNAGDPRLTNAKYQFLNAVYTRVKQVIEAARSMFPGPIVMLGGAIKDFLPTIFKDYSQSLLRKVINESTLPSLQLVSDDKMVSYADSFTDDQVIQVKKLTSICPVFNSLRTNYVTFTEDDFLPHDIAEFAQAYQAPIIRTQTATLPPISTAKIERKLDDAMNAEVLIESPIGDDIAEEVNDVDLKTTLTDYLRNNHVTVPPEYNFDKDLSVVIKELVEASDTASWIEIIETLNNPGPVPRTPPGSPPPPNDGRSGATVRDSEPASMHTDEEPGTGSGSEGLQPFSLAPAVESLPESRSRSRSPSRATFSPLFSRRNARGGIRFTIHRRSESRQTKKNRVRKPRMIDVRV
jgi:hypothetical protein